jgi:ATP phosphoribosyltransferase
MRLGFAPCKMVLGVRRDFTYAGPASLEGKIVATSYPNIARKFFADHNVQVDLRTRDGSVEAIARRNKASAVVDARDSGESLRTNDLKEQEVIFESDAVLVANPALRQQMEKRKDIEGLLKRIISYLRPEFFRWITMNTSSEHEQDIKHILFDYCPSPTVSVCNIDMLDIAAVIPTYNFWKTVDDLQAKGAFKVDQLKIERSIPDLTDPQLRGAIGNLYG